MLMPTILTLASVGLMAFWPKGETTQVKAEKNVRDYHQIGAELQLFKTSNNSDL
jgi:hypothetical protein